MKPADAAVRFRAGNEERSIKMGIDKASEVFTILTLTNLYSDKIMAVIREYSTNAMDSHLAAGVNDPIRVTLPTAARPYFTVEDSGVGLSEDELATIYALYGASTARGSDTATGMLGLGCKSALTYSVSFTLRATKDGVTTLADISKGEDGVGVINVLSSTHTGEPNGVKVTVPVSRFDIETFRIRAQRFFFYWRSGVLVDGVPPENITTSEDHRRIDDDVYVRTKVDQYDYDSYYVQGNVAYPVRGRSGVVPIVAYVDMGSLDFVPSREALHLTPRTEACLEMTRDWATGAWSRYLEDEVSTLNDYERIKFFCGLSDHLMPRFKGKRPLWAKLGMDLGFGGRKGFKVDGGIWGSRMSKIESFRSDYVRIEGVSWVTGFPFKNLVAAHQERLKTFGVTTPYTVLPDSFTGVDLSSFPDTVKWEDVPKLKRAPARRGDRKPTVYESRLDGRAESLTRFPDQAKLVYIEGVKWDKFATMASRYSSAFKDVYFVRLSTRQVAKFIRDYPHAIQVDAWIARERYYAHSEVTQDHIAWRNVNSNFRAMSGYFRSLEEEGLIKNEHFMSMLLPPGPQEDLANRLRVLGWPDTTIRQTNRPLDLNARLVKAYPLLELYRTYASEDAKRDYIYYINAKAEEFTKEGDSE